MSRKESDNAEVLVGMHPDEMTHKQLRAALRHAATLAAMRTARKAKGSGEPDGDEGDDEEKENDDLVDLHAEHTGDSKPPKVTKDDLPKGVKLPKEEDDEEEDS